MHDMLGMLAVQGERRVRAESATTRIGAMNLHGESLDTWLHRELTESRWER